ncbi:hypothetical protein P43SY_007919 [Pythium insidiosum]|uniref:Uncharacterized protein n=1 Tax=Pythium insidiosum TaxID=114742 RepID=A0AAD5QAU8_PYTIN|nr:hypothetical protein P43SY_007919 [Pythium insidiosum]
MAKYLLTGLQLATLGLAALSENVHQPPTGGSVFDPYLHNAAAVQASYQRSAPPIAKPLPITRTFRYASDFRLDQPFAVELERGETVLLPLQPIRDQLFATGGLDVSVANVAIGLELNVCQGDLLTYVVMNDESHRRFSDADEQCITVSMTSDADQLALNLCPFVHPNTPIAMHLDPTTIKGFALRASAIDTERTNAIAILRSTKATGGFKRSFVAEGADAAPQISISMSLEATELAFETPITRDLTSNGTDSICSDCATLTQLALFFLGYTSYFSLLSSSIMITLGITTSFLFRSVLEH